MTKKKHIAFAWSGIPDYGCRCIGALLKENTFEVSVVATQPSVPLKDLEQSLGQKINWISGTKKEINWSSLNLAIPDLLFLGGYSTPSFNALSKQVKSSHGKVVLMSDNNYPTRLSDRWLSIIRHRLLLRHRFDGIFVPGVSGGKLAKAWGYASDEQWQGLYGADPKIFFAEKPLHERSKTILFIGQFIDRKFVKGLVRAFSGFSKNNPDWKLHLYGSGPLKAEISSSKTITVHDFVQPQELAKVIRESKCLVLPSFKEHWGLVVHEATLSGCAIIVADSVGAGEDLASNENAIIFKTGNTEDLQNAFSNLATWDEQNWKNAQKCSEQLSLQFGPQIFASTVVNIAKKLLK